MDNSRLPDPGIFAGPCRDGGIAKWAVQITDTLDSRNVTSGLDQNLGQDSGCTYSRDGGIGRRAGLKIQY